MDSGVREPARNLSASDRLDSWKEIAAHLGRTVRSVQRWERACGMPVHRHGHVSSSSVYAFRSELDAWWASRCPLTFPPNASRDRAEGTGTVWMDAGPEPPSETAASRLAVMPFADMSAGQDQQYFCDGIVDELITTLAAVPGLRVISHASTRRASANHEMPPEEVATLLGARLLIEGSVHREGERVRVCVRLVDPFDASRVLWGGRYDRPYGEILRVQAEIAESIVSRPELTLLARRPATRRTTRTVTTEAYDAYLRGRFQWNKRTETGLRCALGFFNRAIDCDPTDPLGHAGLADTYTALSGNEYWFPSEGFVRAKICAVRALELDPEAAEPRVPLAMVLGLYEWQWAAAEREFEKALELNPSYANGHHWYGMMLLGIGRLADAIPRIRQAYELDPLSPIITANLGRPFLYLRRYDEAITQFEKALDISPDFWLAHLFLSWVLAAKGDGAAAVQEAEAAVELSDGNTIALLALAEACAVNGEEERARDLVASTAPGPSVPSKRFASAFRVARVYAQLQEPATAFKWLQKSLEERSLGNSTYLTVDPALDSIRGDARFTRYVNALGLGEE